MPSPASMPILKALQGQHPLIMLKSPEEERVQRLITEALTAAGQPTCNAIWRTTSGLEIDGSPLAGSDHPVDALRAFLKSPSQTIIFLDLIPFLQDQQVIRALRDACQELRKRGTGHLFLVASQSVLPSSLEKEICLLEIPLPDSEELRAQVSTHTAAQNLSLPESLMNELALSLRGLTEHEVDHVMHQVSHADLCGDDEEQADLIRDAIFEAKAMMVRKAGYLEYVPTHRGLAEIGGMEVLREWIDKRASLFTQESYEAGLPLPKGILLMGVSGCGKSLAAKTVAAIWKVPIFRLDFNVIFSGLYGSPEATFHQALKTIESVAPAVVWIDEIENGLGMRANAGSTDQNQIFSAFLTWMQEKPPMIFVAATANHIESLPAEIIRKGRFDQVFFCDLPGNEERDAIFKIHLARNGADVDAIDVAYLVIATEGWNGAEIEQVVIAARIDAYTDNRAMTTRDVSRHIRSNVPLSETMAEQIKAIREWAWGRATTASKTKQRL